MRRSGKAAAEPSRQKAGPIRRASAWIRGAPPQQPTTSNFNGGTLKSDGTISAGSGQTFTMTSGTLSSITSGATPAVSFSGSQGTFDYKGGSVTGSGARLYNTNLKFHGGSAGTFAFRNSG